MKKGRGAASTPATALHGKDSLMINLLWIWLLAAPILLAGLSLAGTKR
jgi:hypothetical protein